MTEARFWAIYGFVCFVVVYVVGKLIERGASRREGDRLARDLGFGSAAEARVLLRSSPGSVAWVETRALLLARGLVGAHDVQTKRAAPGVVDVMVAVAWWRSMPRRAARWDELREALQELLPAYVVVGRLQKRVTLLARARRRS